MSEDFANFLTQKRITHIRTPVYHPQANGATERLNKTLKQLIQANILAGKLSRVNVYLTFRMLLYFRNLIASLSNVKCSVMLWSDNRNIMDYWMFVARYCFKYGF